MAVDAYTARQLTSPADPDIGSDADPSASDGSAGPDSADYDAETGCEAIDLADDGTADGSWRWRKPSSLVVGLVLVVAVTAVLGGLGGWYALQAATAREIAQDNALYLETGRQAAINLTSISSMTADADVKRLLDSATDPFAGEFASSSPAFVQAVRQAGSTSAGRVTEAGIESIDGQSANVLVAVSVRTEVAGVADEQPRLWRMRITVVRKSEGAKVSKVSFVP